MAKRRFAVGLPGLVGGLFLTASLLAACAQPTPYQARGEGDVGPRYGYAEQQLTNDRFRVSVSGNNVTSRETVENYLLYRAAELTVERGYPGFRIVARDIEPSTRYVTTYTAGFGLGYGYLPGPYYYGGYGGFPLDGYSRPTTRYHAHAEIQLLRRLPREQRADVYDARELMTQLASTIHRPGPQTY